MRYVIMYSPKFLHAEKGKEFFPQLDDFLKQWQHQSPPIPFELYRPIHICVAVVVAFEV